MTNFLLAVDTTDNSIAIIESVLVGVIVIVVALAALSLISAVWKWVLVARYNRYNKQQVAVNMTGSQVAEKMLEGLGLTDVKVEKLGFWKGLFLGNSYSPKKKTIRLRSNIYDKASVTAVALATQKVAIAKRHHDGDKKVPVRAALMKVGYFAPFSILPLIVLGVILDFALYNGFNIFTIILTIVSVLYFLLSFIIVILNLKVEKQACNSALEFMKTTNVLTEDEIKDAKALYKTYITDYVIEFVYDIVYILWTLIKVFVTVAGNKDKK